MSQLSMYVGDTKTINLAVTQNATPVDISTWTFEFAAATALHPSPAPVGFTVDNAGFQILDGPGGLASVTIPSAATSGLNLQTDTLFYYSFVGTEQNLAVHTLAVGSLAIRLGADDVVP
jgi:hypothetical protein